jgi:predicted nucleotide-binding protein
MDELTETNNDLGTTEVFDETMAEFQPKQQSYNLLVQMQDFRNAEKLMRKLWFYFEQRKDLYAPDENIYVQINLKLLQAGLHFNEATASHQDEAPAKAVELLQKTEQICAEAKANYNKISPEGWEVLEAGLRIFEILFFYYDEVVPVVRETFEKAVEKLGGKYVNEVESNRLSAEKLREIDFTPFSTDEPEVIASVGVFEGFIEATAQKFEKNADRILRKQEQYPYLDPIDNRVFIIHGHHKSALLELKELLRDELGITPIILSEEPDGGRTVIEKFEHYGRSCAFAFAFLTKDDLIIKEGDDYFQARLNVLYELGWFCGRYGRARVRIIKQKETAIPSDLGGLIAHEFEHSVMDIFINIKKDLEGAGLIKK